jgi:aspartokinase/homoserine dehydrogenase 1
VPHDQGEKALAALKSQFELELARSTINSVSLLTDMSVVAIIGEGMAFSPGVAARFLKALAQGRVNVRAIAQGSSERQIAVVVNAADASRALRSVHQAFTLSDTVVSVAVLGATGAVGTLFLKQLKEQANTALSTLGIQIKVMVAADKEKMVYDEKFMGLKMETLSSQMQSSEHKSDLDKVTDLLATDVNPHRVVIDLTNSNTVANLYDGWVKTGVHVLGHNKNMGSGDLARYKSLKSTLRFGTTQWQYGATVGAALPFLSMASDLVNTGDKVHEVYGCLSGTMAYILDTFDKDLSFTDAAKQAVKMGYAHHNVAHDLDGTNAARKLVIIARELGMDLKLEDVKCESLLPAGFDGQNAHTDAVLEAAKTENAKLLARKEKASAAGKVLRHVSHIDMASGKAQVRVEEVDTTSPLFRLKCDENLISYKTDRYNTSPLICKGAAAGAELTASGVLADLLRLARSFT